MSLSDGTLHELRAGGILCSTRVVRWNPLPEEPLPVVPAQGRGLGWMAVDGRAGRLHPVRLGPGPVTQSGLDTKFSSSLRSCVTVRLSVTESK